MIDAIDGVPVPRSLSSSFCPQKRVFHTLLYLLTTQIRLLNLDYGAIEVDYSLAVGVAVTEQCDSAHSSEDAKSSAV